MNATATQAPPASDLELALAVSGRLRECVEAADWQAAAALEAERRGLLERYFSAPPPAAELGRAVALLRQLIRLNDELVGMAEHVQRGLAREADTVATGRRATRAYAAHTL